MKIADTAKGAWMSPCRLYRMWLSRSHPNIGAGHIKTACFVLNNPSTADDKEDDPTATRGWDFTEKWGCNHMVFVNTNCYRTPHPSKRKPMPPEWRAHNDDCLIHYARHSDIIVCAWGDKADPVDAGHALMILRATGRPLYRLGELTKASNPRHILYLKSSFVPVPL
jgi:hypothetical protein